MYARSPELMNREDTALVVIDVQEKLLPAVRNPERLVWNIRRLLNAAKLLDIPVLVTEQYPQGLGKTVPELAAQLPPATEKLTFSCAAADGFLASVSRKNVLLTGMETHVCVQQTALDLVAAGYRVFLAVDAVSGRLALDSEIAQKRMELAGVTLTTTETALFEWCFAAGTEIFKEIRTLVMEKGPTDE